MIGQLLGKSATEQDITAGTYLQERLLDINQPQGQFLAARHNSYQEQIGKIEDFAKKVDDAVTELRGGQMTADFRSMVTLTRARV